MRKFLKIFLRSLGTYLGARGGLTRPLVIVGFPRLVILITYGMRYFTMEAVSLVWNLPPNLTSVPMWIGAVDDCWWRGRGGCSFNKGRWCYFWIAPYWISQFSFIWSGLPLINCHFWADPPPFILLGCPLPPYFCAKNGYSACVIININICSRKIPLLRPPLDPL